MSRIELETRINADQKVVFDLSRSVDLHVKSTEHTREQAIDGVTSGLMNLNDTVTWRARHLGVVQTLTTKITAMNFSDSFTDEMVKGVFIRMKHLHLFNVDSSQTLMKDVFEYTSPFGWVGRTFDQLYLRKYMTNLLLKRNQTIKDVAESGKWKNYLNSYRTD